jgi:hypothetical protein
MRIIGITLAACCLLMAGCKSHKTVEGDLIDWNKDVSKAAVKAVDDPVRAAKARSYANELTAELGLFVGEIKANQARFERLNSDYDTSRAEFERLYQEGRRQRRARAEKLVRITLEMRKQMSAEEWSRFVAKTEPPISD